jgi:hypothetical protein
VLPALTVRSVAYGSGPKATGSLQVLVPEPSLPSAYGLTGSERGLRIWPQLPLAPLGYWLFFPSGSWGTPVGTSSLLTQWSFGESAYGHKCTQVHTGECSRKYEHALVPFGTYRKDYLLIKLSLQKKESELFGYLTLAMSCACYLTYLTCCSILA